VNYRKLTTSLILAVTFVATIAASPAFAADNPKGKWITLFDGKTLDGWKASENPLSWQIIDGALAAKGPRSHLFYSGTVADHKFKNFELSLDVKAEGDANAGIYFHTKYQEKGWPDKGFEFQVVNSTFAAHENKNNYTERKKTGSLYGVRNIGKSPVKNDEWFKYRITVQGKTIRGYINGRLMVDYTEPEKPYQTKDGYRVLSDGTFAFQCHDPHSTVFFKNIKVRPLPDATKTPGKPLKDTAFENRLRKFGSSVNLPTADFHVHLANGLSTKQLLRTARRYGFTYGIAFACGANTKFATDESLRKFLDGYDRPPETYLGMQAEGRDWAKTFSEATKKRFDYVFTDATRWTPQEVNDPQRFMDRLVNQIVDIVSKEPIDICANATYLPKAISKDYDSLWTDLRMDQVIKALVENDVAMEINARLKIPSAKFIKKAKAAGVKFTFGTDNTGPQDLGRLDYCLQMAGECQLKRKDFWFPNAD
jgi:hypothetical protein